MASAAAISVAEVSHWYGERQALDQVSFDVQPGEIFGLLGPNGGGKTTLFRVLSTLLPLQSGTVTMLGLDLARQPAAVRSGIGVTFQAPSLDRKLTVYENLRHQGHLYGLSGRQLRARIDDVLARLGIAERASDRAESLSGGLQRRVEIAKGLLHSPRVLLLDEPSTGLDPGARRDLWQYLRSLQRDEAVTVLVTTHLMEEAERCDRLGILDRGRLVAEGTPSALRSSIGGDCITIHCDRPDELAAAIKSQFQLQPQVVGPQLRIETAQGADLLRQIFEAFRNQIASIGLGKPTLEDVFVQRTGHRFWDETTEPDGGSLLKRPR